MFVLQFLLIFSRILELVRIYQLRSKYVDSLDLPTEQIRMLGNCQQNNSEIANRLVR